MLRSLLLSLAVACVAGLVYVVVVLSLLLKGENRQVSIFVIAAYTFWSPFFWLTAVVVFGLSLLYFMKH
jgi:hypothetical protein